MAPARPPRRLWSAPGRPCPCGDLEGRGSDVGPQLGVVRCPASNSGSSCALYVWCCGVAGSRGSMCAQQGRAAFGEEVPANDVRPVCTHWCHGHIRARLPACANTASPCVGSTGVASGWAIKQTAAEPSACGQHLSDRHSGCTPPLPSWGRGWAYAPERSSLTPCGPSGGGGGDAGSPVRSVSSEPVPPPTCHGQGHAGAAWTSSGSGHG